MAEFCIYCGRPLIDVTELDPIHDTVTGERRLVVWRQCPRFPRWWGAALFRGAHISYRADMPMLERSWR